MPANDLPADLPAALSAELSTLLERYQEAAARSNTEVSVDDTLMRVFAISPFVAEIAIRRAAEFEALVHDPDISQPLEREDYDQRVTAALADCSDTPTAKQALRLLRQREMARIAWRDIALKVDVNLIMAELSAFADAVIAGAVVWLGEQLEPRYGRAYGPDEQTLELLVIGMGKLGGGELNFSSDIDLIFIYGTPGTTRGGRKEVTHQDYFDRLGREFIGLLNENTGDGFVFRVDMRLRPFGDSGPLSASMDALEHYYSAHGRDWERYALIKARAVSGDHATREALSACIRPFVYRRYLDYGALDALREMKRLIDREAATSTLANNVKRGPGGIREIEFTAQLFQLTRGGREARLRIPALKTAFNVCRELGLLESAEVEVLVEAYDLLRTTEHRVQQVHDWQTHSLPDDAANQARLAWAMGEPDWPSFRARLDRHRGQVRALFRTLLEVPGEETGSQPGQTPWAAICAAAESGGDAIAAAAVATGVSLQPATVEMLTELGAERFLSRLSSEGQKRLARLLPLLLEQLHQHGEAEATTRRIAVLLHTIARRSVYLAFLADNPDALKRLLLLFEASPWIAEQIISQPLLLDELLDQRVLYAPPDAARLKQLVHSQVRLIDGLEQAMENLRGFRNQQVLRVAASDVTDQFPVAEVSNQLSYIAEACIDSALALAWDELTARFGAPMYRAKDQPRAAEFSVIAYGKLGGLELGYGSDLDLVFVHDSSGEAQRTAGEKSIENEVFFTRLVQRFIHILSTTTAAGRAYEIDTRLRPSGSAGMLVSSIDAYRDYLTRDAWVWEHQALVRARGCAGNTALIERFDATRAEVLGCARDAAPLRLEIASMRQRMLDERDRSDSDSFDLKHGLGGITDIEFMVQYAVLAGAAAHPSLLAWTDNLRLLETIAALELLPAECCTQLHDAYFVYRAEIHRCTLQQIESRVDIARFAEHRAHVIEIWKQLFELN